MRMRVGLAAAWVCVFLGFGASWAQEGNAPDAKPAAQVRVEGNLLVNDGFEDGFAQWERHNNKDAEVTWDISEGEAHSGTKSLHVTSKSGKEEHVFGTITQTVKTTPQTRYRLSVWIKGDNVGDVWFGGGKDWKVRHRVPGGVYGWREVSFFHTTEAEEYAFPFRINIDGSCRNLWIDDVSIAPIGPGVSETSHALDELGELAFLPILPPKTSVVVDGKLDEWAGASGAKLPAVADQVDMRGWKGKGDLSYSVRAAWDENNLYLAIAAEDDVLDASPGSGMWRKDCVQLAFGVDAERYGPEYGFSMYDGHPSLFRWTDGVAAQSADGVKLAASRSGTTTVYEACLPWTTIYAARPEGDFRMNLILNDSDGEGRKGWIGWRPGIGAGKDPSAFVRCRLLGGQAGVTSLLQAERTVLMKDETVNCDLLVLNPTTSPVAMAARLKGGDHAFSAAANAMTKITFAWHAAETGEREIASEVMVGDTGEGAILTCKVTVDELDIPGLQKRFDEMEAKLPVLGGLMEKCKAKGVAAEYERVNLTVLKNFVGYGREDIGWERIPRAKYVADELDKLYRDTEASLNLYLNGVRTPLPVKRYVTGPVAIKDYGFEATVKDRVTGETETRPLHLWGYGHFGQVRKDIPQLQDYGADIIQFEIGPRSVVFPPKEEGKDYSIRTDAVEKAILEHLRRAEENNVLVNVLLSPHYFPDWALKKWPELDKKNGFLKMPVDAPQTKLVIEAFLRTIVPMIKDSKALHSLCLSNEPVYPDAVGDRYTEEKWSAYLAGKYKTIAALNTVYGGSYADFAAVPVPDPNAREAAPLYADYARFNMDRFAAWHQWMADVIHDIAPEIPVHAKIMNRIFNHSDILDGVDPEQFGQLSQINGNDNWCYYTGDVFPYMKKLWFYDLQCSLKKAPVFNSEDHIIPDGDTRYIPQMAPHLRTDIWQGAVHGRSASTMWLWERTGDAKNKSAEGSILHRPDCVAIAGRTNLDLNRLGHEIKALQDTPYTARILYSVPAIVYTDTYCQTVSGSYTALTLSGCKVGFVSEPMLAAGMPEETKLIVVPNATHMLPATLAGLDAFIKKGGTVLVIGEESLAFTAENQPQDEALRQAVLKASRVTPLKTQGDDLKPVVAPLCDELGLRDVVLIDDADGKEANGIEWRVAVRGGKTLLNMVNYTVAAKTVRIVKNGQPVTAFRDRIGEKDLQFDTVKLEPITPWLIEF